MGSNESLDLLINGYRPAQSRDGRTTRFSGTAAPQLVAMPADSKQRDRSGADAHDRTQIGGFRPFLRRNASAISQSDEILDCPDFQLHHHPSTVDLDRLLDDAELISYFSVAFAGDDVGEHLALPRRERGEQKASRR
jgi:hypothetical protein